VNGAIVQKARSSCSQQDRHQGRRVTLVVMVLTQNPAGFRRQRMHSWTVRGGMPVRFQ
jgi:hypothetical protein